MEAWGQKNNLKNNWSLHADEKKEQGEALMIRQAVVRNGRLTKVPFEGKGEIIGC